MTAPDSTGTRTTRRWLPGRRAFLGGVGASGLATAATLFGQATPAAATVAAGCCNLCFSPTHSVAQCETGQYYVWSCPYGSQYLYCNCCEHGASGDNCNHVTYSSYSCQY
jgi:hypothetical protein